MKKLFSCLYGSGLYGTRTPTSDRDVKHIALPSLDHLLLGKKVVNTVYKTNNQKNTRNGVDDVDEEFIPLQIFAKDFMMGQTYALELAYAIDGNHAEQTFYSRDGQALEGREEAVRDIMWEETVYYQSMIIQFVKELREQFLTSNIKAMMGYVVNQASMYSFKGERLNASRELYEILASYCTEGTKEGSLQSLIDWQIDQNFKETGLAFDVWQLSLKYPKYVRIETYDVGAGQMRPCYKMLEKTLPLTMTLGHSMKVVASIISKYGDRAGAASETNVDWKATMHAVRIVDEGLQLLEHHHLEFPFKPEQVERLLSIKRGDVSLSEVTDELNAKLDELKALEQTTTLPPISEEMTVKYEAFMSGWLRKFYAIRESK